VVALVTVPPLWQHARTAMASCHKPPKHQQFVAYESFEITCPQGTIPTGLRLVCLPMRVLAEQTHSDTVATDRGRAWLGPGDGEPAPRGLREPVRGIDTHES
jgi:hypothetical protein